MVIQFLQFLFDFLSKNRWLVWIWSLFILGVCTLPAGEIPSSPFPYFDKLVHAGLFAIWAVLALLAYPKKSLLIILAGFGFGLALEFYQQLLPFGRTFDWWDEVADAVGVMIGFAFKSIVFDRYLQRLY